MEQVSKKPNFFIVGAAKAGTTSLAKYLSEHPDIFIPPEKEPRFFVRDILLSVTDEDPMKQDILDSSILDEETYFKTYDVKESLAGDASVHYLYHYESVIPKILETVGDVPIIIMIRHPVDRLISHYSFLPQCKKSIAEEIADEARKKESGFNSFWFIKSLGFYHEAISAYQRSFSQVKVIVFEDFTNNTEECYMDTLKFLGVRDKALSTYHIHNRTVKPTKILRILSIIKITVLARRLIPRPWYEKLKKLFSDKLYKPDKTTVIDSLKEEILEYYNEDIDKLQRMKGIDIASWRSKKNSQDH